MAISLSYDATNARVVINATGLGTAAAVYIERSIDGGVTWVTTRGGVEVPVSGGALAADHYDYEFTPGVTNKYRIRNAVSVLDTFTRSTSNGWGTSTSGSAWTHEPTGEASDFGVNGTKGWHDAYKEAATRRTLMSGPADGEATFIVTMPEVSTGEAAQTSFIIREDGANANFLCFRVVFLTTGFLDPRISIRQSSVETTLANGPAVLPYIAGTTVAVRARWQGNALSMKMWDNAGPEPWAWTVEVGDDTFTAAGRMGFRSSVGTAWADWDGTVPLRLTYDDFRVVSLDGTGPIITSGDLAVPDLSTVWLKSVTRPFLNQTVQVVGWSDVVRPARGDVFDIVARSYPVAVTDLRGSRRWTLQVRTTDVTARRTLDFLLASGDVVFVHVPEDCPVPGGYVRIGDTSERRTSQYGTNRVFSLPCVEVARPGPDVTADTTTWDAVLAEYADWDAVLADNADWETLVARLGDPASVVVP